MGDTYALVSVRREHAVGSKEEDCSRGFQAKWALLGWVKGERGWASLKRSGEFGPHVKIQRKMV